MLVFQIIRRKLCGELNQICNSLSYPVNKIFVIYLTKVVTFIAPRITKLPDGRNALHSSIIDVFNEFGVQIMSPNFVMQPKAAVVVPQEAWYAAPAVAPQEPEK